MPNLGSKYSMITKYWTHRCWWRIDSAHVVVWYPPGSLKMHTIHYLITRIKCKMADLLDLRRIQIDTGSHWHYSPSVRANQRTPFWSQPEYATNEWREYVRCMKAATEIQRWVEIHTGKGTECHSQLRKVYPAYVRGGRQTCQRRRIDGTENGLYW